MLAREPCRAGVPPAIAEQAQQLGQGVGVALPDGRSAGPGCRRARLFAGRPAAAAGRAAPRCSSAPNRPRQSEVPSLCWRTSSVCLRLLVRLLLGQTAVIVFQRVPQVPAEPGKLLGVVPGGRARPGRPPPPRRPRRSSEHGSAASVSQATDACSPDTSPAANAARNPLPPTRRGRAQHRRGGPAHPTGRRATPARCSPTGSNTRMQVQPGPQPARRGMRPAVGGRPPGRRSSEPGRATQHRPGSYAVHDLRRASSNWGPDSVHSPPFGPGTACCTTRSTANRRASSAAVTG